MKMRTQSNPQAQRIRQMSNLILKSTEQDLERAASILRDDELRVSKYHQRLSRAAEQQVVISQQMNQKYDGQREMLKQKSEASQQMNLKCSSTPTRYRFNPELDVHYLQHSQHEPQDAISEEVVMQSKEYFLPEQQKVQQQISDEEEIKEQQKEEAQILANQELRQKSDALEVQHEQIQINPKVLDVESQVVEAQEQNALPKVAGKHHNQRQCEQQTVRQQSVCGDHNSTNCFTQENFSVTTKDNQLINEICPFQDKSFDGHQKSSALKALDNKHMAYQQVQQQTNDALPISPDTASKYDKILKTENHFNIQVQNQQTFRPSTALTQDNEELNQLFTHSTTPHHLIGNLRRSEVQDCNLHSSSIQINKLGDNQQYYKDQFASSNFEQPTIFCQQDKQTRNDYGFRTSTLTQRDQIETQLSDYQLDHQVDKQGKQQQQFDSLLENNQQIPHQADAEFNKSMSTKPKMVSFPNQPVSKEQVLIQTSLSKEYNTMPSNIFSITNVNDVLEQSKQITRQRQQSSLSSVQDKVLDSIVSDCVVPQINKNTQKLSNDEPSQQQTLNMGNSNKKCTQSDIYPKQSILPDEQSNQTIKVKPEQQESLHYDQQQNLIEIDTCGLQLHNSPEQKQQIYELSPNSLRTDIEVQPVVDDPLVNPFISPELNEQKFNIHQASTVHQNPTTQAFGFQVYCQMEELQLLQEGFQKRLWDHGLSQDVVDNLGQNDDVVFNQCEPVQEAPVLEMPEKDQQIVISETTQNSSDRRLQHKQNMETLKQQQALQFPHSLPKDSKKISVQEAQAIVLKNKIAASKRKLFNQPKLPTIIHKNVSDCDPNYYIERNKQIVKSIDNESKYYKLNHSSTKVTDDFGNNVTSFPLSDNSQLQSFNKFCTDFSNVSSNNPQTISDQISNIQQNDLNKYVLRNIEESKTYKCSGYYSQLDNYVQSQTKNSPCKNYNERQKHFALSQSFKQRSTPIGIELVTSKRSDLEYFYPTVNSGVQLDYAILNTDFQSTMDFDTSMLNQPINKDMGFAQLQEVQLPRSSTPVHQLNRKIYQLAQKNEKQSHLQTQVISPTMIMQSQPTYVPKTPEYYHAGVSQMNTSKALINNNLSYLKTMQLTQNEINDQQQVILLMTGDPEYTLQHYDEVQQFAEELVKSQVNF